LKRFFHVTSTRNRESIETHGLDWTRMKDVPGIAGSVQPEEEGCFLCLDEWEASWFVRMNNTGGSVDVWAVDGVEEGEILESPEGFSYVRSRIPPQRLTLVRADVDPEPDRS
jgi:hypothetical protein